MPRHDGSAGRQHATKQKGKPKRGFGIGTYSRKKKSAKADRYDRPYLTGSYRREES